MGQARKVAAELTLGRTALALSRRQLARRAGVATSTVVRIEAGDPGVQLDTLVAVASAAGIDVVVRAYPGGTPRLRDTGQLALADQLRALANPRWRPQLELAIGEYGRSADLVFFGPDEILHFEIERAATDYQAQYRSADSKRDALAAIHARPVRLILAVEDTVRNRLAITEHQGLIATSLPAGSREIMSALRHGHPLGRDGLLWVRRSRSPRPSA